jgi:hypothetical protein
MIVENKDNPFINIYSGSSNSNEPILTQVLTDSYLVQTCNIYQEGEYVIQKAIVVSKGDEFLKTVSGNTDVIKLLLTAVNNRTIERDYFKLYCEMLDSSITEEEFDEIIASNGNDYIVNETDEPDENQIKAALQLANHIKGVNSVNDFTSLFSFSIKKLEAILDKSNC